MRSRPFGIRTSALASLAGTLALTATLASAQSPVVQKHVPAIVESGRARLLSAQSTTERLHLALALPIHNQDALDALLTDLYNPNSPNFHKWITPDVFEARFGPTKAERKALVAWAQQSGLEIVYRSDNGRVIEVEGPVDLVNQIFNVTMNKYYDPVLDREFHAPDREPTTSLGITLLDVEGLSDATPKITQLKRDPALSLPPLIAAPTTGLGKSSASQAISDNGGGQTKKPNLYGSGPSGTYLPSDIRTAYYGNGNLTGAGQTVAIFSFDGYLTSDLNLYLAQTNMTNTIPVTNVLTGGYSGGCFSTTNGTSGTCDDGEQILDLAQVIGMAPGLSSILFYEGTAANTILAKMASDNLAKVITSSWAGGGFAASSDTYFQQMATQGQTFLNASGDSGAVNKTTYFAPTLDANITQVGGTDLVTNGANGSYASEIGWADSTGGFWITGMTTASKILIPSWQSQAGVVTTTNKASATYRNVPDISAEANFDNPTADNGVFELGYGGTSFAAPRIGGYLALANQQAVLNGNAAGLGFINPALYTAGLSANAANIYHDVASGTNANTSTGTPSYTSVAGYDLVTGWGSPNGTGLLNYLAGTPVADFAEVTSPVSLLKAGTAVTSTVSLTPYNSFAGTVTLTATNLPTGVTASYTSGTPSAPPTITLAADATSTPSTYNVTVTGTSGNLVHTAILPVTITKRSTSDFTMTATSASVLTGSTGGSTITVTPGAGVSGGIALTLSGVPYGVTATLSTTTTPYYVDQPSDPSNVTLSFTVPGSITPGTYNVVVTGTSSANIVHTVTVPLTIALPTNLLTNGGFETGTAAPWTMTNVGFYGVTSGFEAHTGNYFTLLAGGSAAKTSTAVQTVSIPSTGTKATLGYWLFVLTNETGTTAVDTFTAQIVDGNGNTTTLGAQSNLSGTGYWTYYSFDISAYIGQTVTVQLVGKQAGTTITDFLLDDVSVSIQ